MSVQALPPNGQQSYIVVQPFLRQLEHTLRDVRAVGVAKDKSVGSTIVKWERPARAFIELAPRGSITFLIVAIGSAGSVVVQNVDCRDRHGVWTDDLLQLVTTGLGSCPAPMMRQTIAGSQMQHNKTISYGAKVQQQTSSLVIQIHPVA